jgi:hypothetical protein
MTPMTLKGTLRTRIVCSSGSPSPNRLRATVRPSRTTISPRRISSGSKLRPLSTSHSRAAK